MSGSWQDHWETDAAQERERYASMSLDTLLSEVSAGRYGSYYQIWMSIAEHGDARRSGWILFGIIESAEDELHRYHCADALLQLLGTVQMAPADVSADHPQRESKLAELARAISYQAGPRPF